MNSVTTWFEQDFNLQVPFLETPIEFPIIINEATSFLPALYPLPLVKGSCGSFHFLLFDAGWVPVSHSVLSISEHQKIKMVVPLEGSISISSNSRRGSVTQKLFSYKRLVFQKS